MYARTQVLDEFFEPLLNQVIARMNTQPMQDHLKRHLLSVLLTAISYNPKAALTFMEQRNLVNDFFTQLLQDDLVSSFTNTYERKTFIIGLSSALDSPYLP